MSYLKARFDHTVFYLSQNRVPIEPLSGIRSRPILLLRRRDVQSLPLWH